MSGFLGNKLTRANQTSRKQQTQLRQIRHLSKNQTTEVRVSVSVGVFV